MNKKVVLIGGGDFCKKIIKLLKLVGNYTILGYTDIEDQGDVFCVQYLGDDNVLPQIIQNNPYCNAIVCIAGNLNLIKLKERLISNLLELGFKFPTLIAPSAYIDEATNIGEGCIIFDNVYVDFGVNIGAFSVINLGTVLCHDSFIGQFVTISPKGVTGGGSYIGDNSFLGINATIRPYSKVNSNCIIGLGAVVTKDCLIPGVYIGNPAKIR